MVDKFSEAMDRKTKKQDPNMAGAFGCQTCNEVVLEAHYNLEESSITWVCPDGHTSTIKDVTL